MGCDGGTIPKRDELVKTKKKKEQKDAASERLYRWQHCSVSQRPLVQPVVACELGRLYNKDEVIARLLSKTQEASSIGHIRGLKDVKELVLARNPAHGEAAADPQQQLLEASRAAWICPVSGLEMNGKHGFCFSWTCGCAVSKRALKEIQSSVCSSCGSSISPDDVININPRVGEELEAAETSMSERRKRAKLAKKEGKRKAEAGDEGKTKDKTDKKPKISVNGGSNGAGPSKASTSISGLASSILRDTEFSNVRSREFSVANNPKNSEVYKSIFDTHKSANKKLKSNWVTCNPQYY